MNGSRKKKWNRARKLFILYRKLCRKLGRNNHAQQKKAANFLVSWVYKFVGFLPKLALVLILVIIFAMNLIPLPILTLVSVIMAKIISRVKLGLALVLVANVSKPTFIYVVCPWFLHFISVKIPQLFHLVF